MQVKCESTLKVPKIDGAVVSYAHRDGRASDMWSSATTLLGLTAAGSGLDGSVVMWVSGWVGG